MSTLKVDNLQTTAGVDRYLASAWVNFNGTGTVAIRGDGNVTSITDNGVGDYTVTYTVVIVDTNYVGIGGIGSFETYADDMRYRSAPSTTSAQIRFTGGSNIADSSLCHFAILE